MLDGEVIAVEPPPSLNNRLDSMDAAWPEPRRSRMSLVGGAGRRSRLVVVNRGRESVESGSFSRASPANGRQSASELKVMNKKEQREELKSQVKGNGEGKGKIFRPRTGKTASGKNDDDDDVDMAGSFGMPVTPRELLDEVEGARRMVDERMDWFWVDDGGMLRYKYCGLPVKELF